MSVALFDLDRTVIDCNSGTAWLRLEWKDGRVGVRDAAWAAYVLGLYSLGVGEHDAAFAAAVAKYAGQEESFIAERTRTWFERDIAWRVRPGAQTAIAKHRDRGDRLVIATSSSIYAAGAAQRAYGFTDAIASRFEVGADGRFTGKVASSAYGAAKLDRARDWAVAAGVDLADCTFYTDSATDLPLLEVVGTPVAVNPDRSLRRVAAARGWAIVDWGLST